VHTLSFEVTSIRPAGYEPPSEPDTAAAASVAMAVGLPAGALESGEACTLDSLAACLALLASTRDETPLVLGGVHHEAASNILRAAQYTVVNTRPFVLPLRRTGIKFADAVETARLQTVAAMRAGTGLLIDLADETPDLVGKFGRGTPNHKFACRKNSYFFVPRPAFVFPYLSIFFSLPLFFYLIFFKSLFPAGTLLLDRAQHGAASQLVFQRAKGDGAPAVAPGFSVALAAAADASQFPGAFDGRLPVARVRPVVVHAHLPLYAVGPAGYDAAVAAVYAAGRIPVVVDRSGMLAARLQYAPTLLVDGTAMRPTADWRESMRGKLVSALQNSLTVHFALGAAQPPWHDLFDEAGGSFPRDVFGQPSALVWQDRVLRLEDLNAPRRPQDFAILVSSAAADAASLAQQLAGLPTFRLVTFLLADATRKA
jgi:hypothetical protein